MSSQFQAGPSEPDEPKQSTGEYGPYRIERDVERYGLVTIYIARNVNSQHPVLLTVFRPDSIEAAQRWTERLKAIQWLQHDHILLATEGGITSGAAGGEQYTITPFLPLLLAKNRILTPQATLDATRQIVAALDYAHGQGIVHGMMRPPHVVMTGPGRVALRGWELAGGSDQSTGFQPASDIAWLARIVHHAITGEDVKGGSLSPRLPQALIGPLENALPGGRGYDSARAFQAALIQAIGKLSPGERGQGLGSSPRPATAHRAPGETRNGAQALPAPVKPRRGRALAVILFTFATLIVAASIAVVFLSQSDPRFAALVNPQRLLCPGCTPGDQTAQVVQNPTDQTATSTPQVIPDLTVTATDNLVTPSIVPILPTSTSTVTPTPNSTAVYDSSDATSIPSTTPSPVPTDTPAPPAGIVTATPAPFTPGPTTTGTDTPLPSETSTATITPMPPKSCISLVGDSVTHGGITYEIPEVGYIVGLTHPLAEFVNNELANQGINDLTAYDRGASNTGINSYNHGSYFKTLAYSNLLQDHCKFTVIMPWYNDITPGNEPQANAAPEHVRAIIGLVQTLTSLNPQGWIIVMNYFQGNVAPFAANTWASGFTPDNRDLYNHQIQLSCDLGTLSKTPQVTCRNTDDAFVGMGTSYVISTIGRNELMNNLVAPLNDVQQGWVNDYFAQNPNGLLQGDGIHLSSSGKTALADYLIKVVKQLGDGPIPNATESP